MNFVKMMILSDTVLLCKLILSKESLVLFRAATNNYFYYQLICRFLSGLNSEIKTWGKSQNPRAQGDIILWIFFKSKSKQIQCISL